MIHELEKSNINKNKMSNFVTRNGGNNVKIRTRLGTHGV